jgi:membrane glycosyltransferase
MRSSNLQRLWQALCGIVFVAILLIVPSFKWIALAFLVSMVGHVIISRMPQNSSESDVDLNPNSNNDHRHNADNSGSYDSDKK